jgi:hypothetical protein
MSFRTEDFDREQEELKKNFSPGEFVYLIEENNAIGVVVSEEEFFKAFPPIDFGILERCVPVKRLKNNTMFGWYPVNLKKIDNISEILDGLSWS